MSSGVTAPSAVARRVVMEGSTIRFGMSTPRIVMGSKSLLMPPDMLTHDRPGHRCSRSPAPPPTRAGGGAGEASSVAVGAGRPGVGRGWGRGPEARREHTHDDEEREDDESLDRHGSHLPEANVVVASPDFAGRP